MFFFKKKDKAAEREMGDFSLAQIAEGHIKVILTKQDCQNLQTGYGFSLEQLKAKCKNKGKLCGLLNCRSIP